MPDRFRILMSKRVSTDLETIFNFIAKDSLRNASDFVRRILESIESLDTFPLRNLVPGQPPGLKRPIRSLPVKPYLIFYYVDEDHRTVRVLRVRHGARRKLRRYR